jgi:hypothetical protein
LLEGPRTTPLWAITARRFTLSAAIHRGVE